MVLLANPTAGGGRGGRLVGLVAALLRAQGTGVEVVSGRDTDDAFDLLRAAVEPGVDQGADAVVALGGDGLVNLAVQVVAETEIALGIVAAGTGNDVARALGLPLGDPVAAVDVILKAIGSGQVRRVDAGRAAGRWFAGVLSSGFDSMVNERANRMRWPRGPARYNVAIAAELRTFRPVPYLLELDGVRWETEAMLVAVGNGSSYGGGMRICPGADLADGLFDVSVLGTIGTAEFVRMFPSVYSGRHVEHPALTVRRAREVSLVARGVTAYADGERISALPVTCEVVPGALNVLAPVIGAP